MGDHQDELGSLRDRIDAVDRELLRLVSERGGLARRIGEIKHGNVYRPEREAQVLRRIAEMNPGPLADKTVQYLFREIMSACLALEQPLRIAYLGPAGTFTEAAAHKHFGSAPGFSPCATIDEVFRAVEAENADYGVVPVENSTEGAIGRTLDLLLTSSVMICGEVVLRVHQNLMSATGDPAAVTRLYSHAQSLAQCHEWLNRNLPDVPRIAVASNAEAARLAAAEPGAAAIAGEAAARLYDLRIAAACIEDDPNNTTRFLVVAAHDAGPSGQDKTSVVCSAQNKPGAVHDMLTPLREHGVSMSKFESRPARGGSPWEYVFFIDVDGHRSEAQVTVALDELRARAGFVKELGSYPKAAI